MDWQERIEKKIDLMDGKLSEIVLSHQGIYKDVEWLKGSLRIGVILTIPAVLGFFIWTFQMVITEHPTQRPQPQLVNPQPTSKGHVK